MGPEGKVIGGVAESWEVQGNVWTFKLKKNAKWQNGKQVKAEDFLTGWQRVLNPQNGFEKAYIMFPIKGAMEYNQGLNNDFSLVGIKVLDENTLQVTLKGVLPYFDTLVAQSIFYPLNKKYYESHEKKYGTSKNQVMGNGAYEISKWDSGKEIVLKKSKKYWDTKNIKIKNIILPIVGDETELNESDNGCEKS